jgi:squalene-hopene/tetraprenyl-beta-curcumene cyclase
MIDIQRLQSAYEKVREELLAERTADGHWVGELSSSALSTATAVSALAVVRGPRSEVRGQKVLDDLVERGIAWLVMQQNPDGGFGDTDLSHSNIATTYLVVAAVHLAGVADEHTELIRRANAYIDLKGGLRGLRDRYGIDKTFVVPIMTNLALAGIVDWREVDPLPFELACVPQSWYRFVGMPVVSYAIPALVAIGQARFFHAPPRNPLTRVVRGLSIERSLKVLRRMQPDSGGYLEATPLTSFVVMSLAAAQVRSSKFKVQGSVAADVIQEGVKFLINSARPDGSWPIDTNLATWNTTLAINALAGAGEDVSALLGPQCFDWLLSCQHTERHPFTGADAGGFGWSDLSGALPDADDTAGAVLALAHWYRSCVSTERLRQRISQAAAKAIQWLFGLQNGDRGWPTFCRGWGRLPFDRSGTDLTAHAIRAIRLWRFVALDSDGDTAMRAFEDCSLHIESLEKARTTGADYLVTHQKEDGSWPPLWFGNQDHPHEDNLVYGTAKSLFAYRDHNLMEASEAKRGVAWLVGNQNEDGGWGSGAWHKIAHQATNSLGEPVLSTQYSVLSTPDAPRVAGPLNPKSRIQNLKSSVEETALAVEALLAACPLSPVSCPLSPAASAVARGLAWLLDRVENNQHRQPAPIGFYFAKLWYYERLYPLTFTVAALGRACRQFAPPTQAATTTEPSESRAS